MRSAVARAAVALLLPACGGSPNQPSPPPPPPPLAGPFLTCPADVRLDSRDGQPVAVNYDVATVSGGNPPIEVKCDPAPGTAFPVGSSEVTCAASDTRFQTASCRFTIAVVAPRRIALTRFLAFGDSLTEGKTAVTPTLLAVVFEDAYSIKLQQMLSARYTAQEIVVANDAIGGEQVIGRTVHSPGGEVRISQALDAHRPEVLLLMEGSNDVGAAGREGGRRAINGLEQMIRRAKGLGIRVFLATVPPQRAGGPGRRDETAALLPEFNAGVRALAARQAVPLVEVHDAIRSRMELVGPDDLHLTPEGYTVIAQLFFDAIRNELEVRTSAGSP